MAGAEGSEARVETSVEGGETPPRLILHLGVQKTASTSLHHFLTQNTAALADRLVVRLPDAGTPMRPLGRAAIAYSLDPGAQSAARLTQAMQEVCATLPQDGRRILISHENLAGAMPGNGGETRLFPMLPQIIALLDQAVAPMRPVYVVYRRRMDDWKASVWAQAVRTDGYAGSYEQFLDDTSEVTGWDDLDARLQAAAPGRMHLLDLADEPDPARPGTQLLRLAGIDAASLPPMPRQAMQRLNSGATEFLRRLNGVPLNPQARAKVVDLVAHAQTLFIAEHEADHRPKGTQ